MRSRLESSILRPMQKNVAAGKKNAKVTKKVCEKDKEQLD